MTEAVIDIVKVIFILWILKLIIVPKSSGDKSSIDAGPVIGWLIKAPFIILGCIVKLMVNIFSAFFPKPPQVENSQFQGFWSRRKILNASNNGLVIEGNNRLSVQDSMTHCCLLAPTGGGKSTKYVIPNLLKLNENSSAVVTDPSGEIFAKTSGYLAQRGFKIKVLAPADLKKSLRFNPLARARSHSDLNRIADVLITTAFGNKSQGDQAFWNNGAKNILNVLLRVLKTQDARYQNLGNLRHLLISCGENGENLAPLFARPEVDELTYREWVGSTSQDSRVFENLLSTTKSAMEPFSNPELCRLVASDTLDFESLRTDKVVLFIITPEHLFNFYSFLLSILYGQLFDYALETSGRPLYFFLDEAGNFKIPNLSNLITVLRKRNASVSLILQDTQQLDLLYGSAEASVILYGSCSNKIFMPGLSPKTCEQVEKMLGRTIIKTEKGEVAKPLLAASEVRTMQHEILIQANKPPIRISMQPYYKIPTLRRMSEIPPYRIETPPGEDKLEFLPLDVPTGKD